MSRNIWFCSDHHLGHRKILSFKEDDGTLTRPFSSIEDMHECLITRHNELVNPDAKVYFMGDVTWKHGPEFVELLNRFNGKKRLIVGNHDDPKKISQYFEKVSLWRVFNDGCIPFTAAHVPLHPSSIKGRFQIHGHTHSRDVTPFDKRYLNISLEKTGFRPVSFEGLQNEMSRLENE